MPSDQKDSEIWEHGGEPGSPRPLSPRPLFVSRGSLGFDAALRSTGIKADGWVDGWMTLLETSSHSDLPRSRARAFCLAVCLEAAVAHTTTCREPAKRGTSHSRTLCALSPLSRQRALRAPDFPAYPTTDLPTCLHCLHCLPARLPTCPPAYLSPRVYTYPLSWPWALITGSCPKLESHL